MKKGMWLWFVAMAAVLAACGAPPTPGEAPPEVPPEVPPVTEAPVEPAAELTPYQRALNREFEGSSVTIFGKYIDAEGRSFEAAMVPFELATGIDVQFEGSQEFETLITVRVEAGDAPDVAGFPQPALMAEFARQGAIPDHAAFLDMDQLQEDYSQAWTDLATVDGKLSGVVYRAGTKSIVWYPVEAFEAAGYTAPQTYDELIALTDRILEEQGVTPWCISMEHGGNTGWVATDWIEDVLLRTAPVEVYDQWMNHEIAFDAPEVVNAAHIVEQIWFNSDYVYGGTTGILSIWVGATQTPMFEDPPACWFHKQAGWIPSFWPEGTAAGVDSAFFYFPSIDETYGNPVLGAGDVFSAFNDRPETAALMQYLASPEAAEVWIKTGSFVSPNRRVSLEWYSNYVDRGQAEILQNATTLRFDASDLMPAEVGTGTFWAGMVDWVSGAKPIETVLQEIDASWPE